MRKIRTLCMALVCAFVVCSGAFADQYFSASYSLGGTSFTLKDADVTSESFSPFGVDIANTWYTSSPVLGPFYVGFDLDLAVSISGGPTVDGNKVEDFLYFGEALTAGAAFRMDITDNDAVKLTPGLQMTLDQGIYLGNDVSELKVDNFYVALSLNAAYQHYFTSTMGINVGADVDIPLFGFQSTSGSYYAGGRKYSFSDSDSIGIGFNYRFFAGLAMRF